MAFAHNSLTRPQQSYIYSCVLSRFFCECGHSISNQTIRSMHSVIGSWSFPYHFFRRHCLWLYVGNHHIQWDFDMPDENVQEHTNRWFSRMLLYANLTMWEPVSIGMRFSAKAVNGLKTGCFSFLFVQSPGKTYEGGSCSISTITLFEWMNLQIEGRLYNQLFIIYKIKTKFFTMHKLRRVCINLNIENACTVFTYHLNSAYNSEQALSHPDMISKFILLIQCRTPRIIVGWNIRRRNGKSSEQFFWKQM